MNGNKKNKNDNNNQTDTDTEDVKVFLGSFVHSESWQNPFIIRSNGVIGVKNGKIIFVDVEDNLDALKESYSFNSDNIFILGRGEFLMPGLIDTHIHAPQYPNAGLALDRGLLEWLMEYTFPMESKFGQETFARSTYKKVVQRLINWGTTTASYFATIHQKSSEILAEIVDQYGQRAFVGKVAMDSNSPDYYVESTEAALKSTEEFIVNLIKRKSSRVKPIITPRFALSCSEELMRGLGDLARKYDVNIQSHLCESLPEIERARELFPKYSNYTEIYEKNGLLSNKTIMAHCVHNSEEEIDILAKTETGVSHCPTSNMCLLSGLCPVRSFIDKGVKVGLGTDVSGGYSASLIEAMRHAILTSKVLAIQNSSYEQLSYRDVFFLATLGGAQALSIEKTVGNFVVGKDFDALHIDLSSPGSPIHLFPEEQLDDMVQKFIMLGDDRNIIEVFVEGRKIKTVS